MKLTFYKVHGRPRVGSSNEHKSQKSTIGHSKPSGKMRGTVKFPEVMSRQSQRLNSLCMRLKAQTLNRIYGCANRAGSPFVYHHTLPHLVSALTTRAGDTNRACPQPMGTARPVGNGNDPQITQESYPVLRQKGEQWEKMV